jgi:hypothetical protein
METKSIRKILYVMVMQEESNAILEKGNFTKCTELSDYSNILEAFKSTNSDIYIIRPINDPMHNTCLFGTEISFFITYMGIKAFNPDLVLSMGYAGDTGLGDKLPLGTVVIASEKSIYHRRNMIIKIYENTTNGHYPVLSCANMIKELQYTGAKIGTSNSFVHHDTIAVEKDIKVVEMELCSVARACAYFGTPCVGVKVISDIGEEDVDPLVREKQFLESIGILREQFYLAFDRISVYVLGKSVSDL